MSAARMLDPWLSGFDEYCICTVLAIGGMYDDEVVILRDVIHASWETGEWKCWKLSEIG